MIVKLEHKKTNTDIEISIIYPEKNKTVDSIVSFINSLDKKIEGYIDDIVKQINITDIYYIESDEKTTNVYCEKENYKTKYRLYQLNERFKGLGFVQVSKYCLLNINRIDCIKQLTNRRMEAILTNGKNVFVTRKYLYDIKRALQEKLDDR